MSTCINTFDPEYQYLQKVAGTQAKPFIDYYVLKYLSEKGRYPKIDEIPNMSTREAFNKYLEIQRFNSGLEYTDADKVLSYTGAKDIESSIPILNNVMHPDLEVDLMPVGKQIITTVHERPKQYNANIQDIDVEIQHDPIKDKIIITQMLNELQKLYGIKIKPITTKELLSKKWDMIISDAGIVNAFIYNGDIYVNTDRAKLDAPLHELSHIIIGSLRFLDTNLYSQLLDTVRSLPNYQLLIQQYNGRTENDINEEIFVTEFGKYLSGQQSEFNSFSDQQLDLVLYHVKRVIDSMINGQYTVKNLPTLQVLQSNLLQLGKKTLSSRFNEIYPSSLDLAELHRKLNNTKSDLIKNNELIQECE